MVGETTLIIVRIVYSSDLKTHSAGTRLNVRRVVYITDTHDHSSIPRLSNWIVSRLDLTSKLPELTQSDE